MQIRKAGKQLIYFIVQKYNEYTQLQIRVDSWMLTGNFLKDLAKTRQWKDVTQLYSYSQRRFLDLDADFLQNGISYGDHLIAC